MMGFGAFRRSAVFAWLILLSGCNIFNPDGKGDAGVGTQGDLAMGEDLYRQQDFAGSMAAFERAVREDSANSMAYYGYAKASVRFYDLNASDLLSDLENTQDSSSISFLNHDDFTLTRRLQAASKVIDVLTLLTERDTLTRWFNYLSDSSSTAARSDSLYFERAAFMRDYLAQADQGTPGYRKRNQFPLTDFVMPYDKVLVDFGAFELVYTLTRLIDLDQNDTIDGRDSLMRKLVFNRSGGGFNVDSLGSIQQQLFADSTSRNNLNKLIQSVSSGLTSTTALINLLAPAKGGKDSSGKSISGAASGNVDSVVNSLGATIAFYQFGDAKDNDGDGCVDEEIMDGKDNDDDGFVDEDARVVLDGFPDNVDNDHNGQIDDARENTDTSTAPDTLRISRSIPAHDSTFQVSLPAHDSVTYFTDSARDSLYQPFIPAHDSVAHFTDPAYDSTYDSIAVPAHDTVPAQCFYDTTLQPPQCRVDTIHVSARPDSSVIHVFAQCVMDTTLHSAQCQVDTIHIPAHPDSSVTHIPPQFCVIDTTSHPPQCLRDTIHLAADTVYYDSILESGRPWLLGFVKDFETRHPDSAFVKIKKGDPRMNLRLQVQKYSLLDSIAGKTWDQLSDSVKIHLDSAKAWVGGCWRNYFPGGTLEKKARKR